MKIAGDFLLKPIKYQDMKERLKSWWRGEVNALSILSGKRIERRTIAKLMAFWISTFATGATLYAFGINGYSVVSGGAMWLSAAWLLGDMAGSRFVRDED